MVKKHSLSILDAAEEVVSILKQHRIDAIVIGAVALAAHHYIRQTEDVDLGINANVRAMRAVRQSLQELGFTAEFREPDGEDPLGGVIDVSGSFGLVQIISFADRFPDVIDDALRACTTALRENSGLKLVPIPQLVALKLYAGGYKSKADIVELLRHNPDVDIDALRAVCVKYRLRGLEPLIREARLSV
jgi:hypothetical protein